VAAPAVVLNVPRRSPQLLPPLHVSGRDGRGDAGEHLRPDLVPYGASPGSPRRRAQPVLAAEPADNDVEARHDHHVLAMVAPGK